MCIFSLKEDTPIAGKNKDQSRSVENLRVARKIGNIAKHDNSVDNVSDSSCHLRKNGGLLRSCFPTLKRKREDAKIRRCKIRRGASRGLLYSI